MSLIGDIIRAHHDAGDDNPRLTPRQARRRLYRRLRKAGVVAGRARRVAEGYAAEMTKVSDGEDGFREDPALLDEPMVYRSTVDALPVHDAR